MSRTKNGINLGLFGVGLAVWDYFGISLGFVCGRLGQFGIKTNRILDAVSPGKRWPRMWNVQAAEPSSSGDSGVTKAAAWQPAVKDKFEIWNYDARRR